MPEALKSRNNLKGSSKVRYKMFQINIYQKDYLLNQVIKTYEILRKHSYNADSKFVLSMYEKIQKMKYGESLPVNESVRLRKLIDRATS